MPIAFKEWAVTVRALAEGEQLLTLRKGGIREPDKHFSLDHDRFFLYPTFDHQRNDLIRDSHLPELRRALEEGGIPFLDLGDCIDGVEPQQRFTALHYSPTANAAVARCLASEIRRDAAAAPANTPDVVPVSAQE